MRRRASATPSKPQTSPPGMMARTRCARQFSEHKSGQISKPLFSFNIPFFGRGKKNKAVNFTDGSRGRQGLPRPCQGRLFRLACRPAHAIDNTRNTRKTPKPHQAQKISLPVKNKVKIKATSSGRAAAGPCSTGLNARGVNFAWLFILAHSCQFLPAHDI